LPQEGLDANEMTEYEFRVAMREKMAARRRTSKGSGGARFFHAAAAWLLLLLLLLSPCVIFCAHILWFANPTSSPSGSGKST